MRLPSEDTALFFQLMWGLQFFVNQEQRLLLDVDSAEAYAGLPAETRIRVRDVLWENPQLIGAYIAKNPDNLPAEYLEIIQGWERFIAGTFFIFRFLKKHTIFIGGGQVYGVLALQDSLEDIVGGQRPPIAVKAVLLPFKGRIIYDGLLSYYSVFFGGNIKRNLNEDYMTAKQNGRIVTTFEPARITPTPRVRKRPGKEWRPVVDDLVKTTDKMKGGPVVQSAAFGLLRASAKLAQVAAHNPDHLDEMWRLERQVRRALSRFQTILDRAGS